MSYSFFGTCANDHKQFFGCLNTILKQTILPKEIILIDSGEQNIRDHILEKIKNTNIKLIYLRKNLSRVKSLNIALCKSTSEYSFRFDTRSRFSFDYASNVLNVFESKSMQVDVAGGVPNCISSSNDFESNLCSNIMNRSYIFFYPKHRNFNYSGYASSIYLGCFKTSLLKKIKFNEKKALLSEDSLIINDFLTNGYKAYISSEIKVSYLTRSSFRNTLKLFNTYGYCRSNTIFLSRKLFISSRHLFVFIGLFLLLIFLFQYGSTLSFFLFPLILFIWNSLCELCLINLKRKFYMPFFATLCQFSWILGFLWNLIRFFSRKKVESNFIS
tara:strand:+ start:10576 stop:11562 length:987 start_codon:yes stop_codon:yes gene_type:complete